ncbi:MAG: YhfC family intramembrane metalloprotease [Clostridia bacterium]|nr:YhfC family intramembrane metalloprotease [Clostridia bacterium]
MEKVSVLSIVFMALSAIMSIAVPLGLALHLRKRYRADWLPFIAGYLVMLVFAFILEARVHVLVLGTPTGLAIRSNVFLYAIYGGMMAALFEESGRALAFSTVLRKKDRPVNALMYGAGHGGMEFMMILGVGNINNLIYTWIVNTGQQATVLAEVGPEQAAAVSAALSAVVSTPPGMFLLGLAERLMALLLQLALSCLVFLAVQRGRRRLIFIAMFFHALVDAVAGLLSGLQVSVILIEGCILVMTGAIALFVRKVMQNVPDSRE